MQYKGYTIEILGKTPNRYGNLVDVKATKGEVELTRQFDGIVSIAGLKGAAKNWIDDEEQKTTLPSEGVIDFTEPTPEVVEPTRAELEKAAWQEDVTDLQKAIKMQELGAPIINAAQLTVLQNRVRTNWKSDYKDVTPS